MRFSQDESGQWWCHLKNGSRTRAQTKTCETCGRSFQTIRPAARFCGVLCRTQNVKQPPKVQNCEGCGARFVVTEYKQRFCGHACAATKMHGDRPVTTGDDSTLVNGDNPRFSKDEQGQWWYKTGNASRTRAYLFVCKKCHCRYLASIFHKGKSKGFCSRGCGSSAWHKANPDRFKRDNSKRWKGGRRASPRGYVAIYCPGHPSIKYGTRKYVLEHRLVMEKHLGRFLEANEFVHHKNGVRDDNRIENLELWVTGHPSGQRVNEK
jgi:hypothetical protein